jgi:cytochrome c biogenesis protein CcdA
VNHLLVVGFYLVNFGFVALYLKLTGKVADGQGVIEAVADKLGIVLLVLGAMHFFNLFVFEHLRRNAELDTAPPPVAPVTTLAEVIAKATLPPVRGGQA